MFAIPFFAKWHNREGLSVRQGINGYLKPKNAFSKKII